jgi:hypothetical protein
LLAVIIDLLISVLMSTKVLFEFFYIHINIVVGRHQSDLISVYLISFDTSKQKKKESIKLTSVNDDVFVCEFDVRQKEKKKKKKE